MANRIEPENSSNLYTSDSVVECVRSYWQILAQAKGMESPVYPNKLSWALSVLSSIRDYRENIPQDIRDGINQETGNYLEGIEKRCNEILEE